MSEYVFGRPTKYKPEYCEEMLKFFLEWPEYREVEEDAVSAGRKVKVIKRYPNRPPTLNKFSIKIGVDRTTLTRWAKENPDFCIVYERCVTIYEEFLSDKGLSSEYNAGFAKMLLSNHTRLKVNQEVEVTHSEIKISIDNQDSEL
jgi:hypothetical protein